MNQFRVLVALAALSCASISRGQTTPPQVPPAPIAPAPAAPAAKPPPSPFDAGDPEIAKIKSLNWKTADFSTLDPEHQCMALMALNKGLSNIGAKADARLDLLVDYIDQNDLGGAFESAKGAITPMPQITFEDMKKVATAYVNSPEGAAKLSGQFDGYTPELLARYLALYDKGAQREFAEAVDSRLQVRTMGLFLQEMGKLDEFRTWSIAERQRRQQAYEQKLAADRAQAAEAQAQRKADAQAAAAAAAAERMRQQDLAAQQMSLALAQQQDQSQSAPQSTNYVDDDSWWPSTYYGNGAIYYNNNAYRGQVRDKAQNAYQNWQNRPRPTPRAGGGAGGGIRGGGRR